ncbi:MAG: lipopolysaccharide kinase InaA family protein [Zoogloeaceae bacterium]|jgi:hypothetical protein|nr:lipopolysaccharide kinase InaA family protein [Zoogloeaceae bacterium]
MNDFIAIEDRPRLEQHGLADFEALWGLELTPVDDPNVDRGGTSHVCRLELDGHAYYLKRQQNHLTRNLAHPFGEPTFAREFRNIQRYQQRGVPALQATFYAQRHQHGTWRALLLTRALTGWRDLDHAFAHAREEERPALLVACGHLARRLHAAGLVHGCFYPRHIFTRATATEIEACLIDLEKTRPLWFGRRDRIKDVEQFIRHAPALKDAEIRCLLVAYLDCPPDSPEINLWQHALAARRQKKAGA